MTVRVNLAPNPACKINATGWSSTPTGWARSTSVDAGLARTTGFEGTTAVDVNTPRAVVVPGAQYVFGVQVKANVALSSNMLVNWYDNPTSGGFLSNSGATVPLNLAAGAVARFEVGPYTAPAGAGGGLLKLNDLDGAAEVTAYMVEQTTTLGQSYFDGDTSGATWDSTAGNSTSTFRVLDDAFSFGDSFGVVVTPGGPVGTDVFTFGDSASILGQIPAVDSFGFTDGFLIASIAFDDARGRVRVEAFTFDPRVTTARVSSRTPTAKYRTVRGGTVAVTGGFMARPVDDYEYAAGVETEYLIEGVTDQGLTLQRATVRRTGADDVVWLKFIANPVLNRRITLTGWGKVERESRAGLFNVQNKPEPIAVTDVHSSRRVSITCKTENPAETAELDAALRLGHPAYLQVPASTPLPSMYVTIGSYGYDRPALRSPRGMFELPLTEVEAPDPSVVGAFATWQTVLDTYPTWGAVYEQVGTWRELAA